MQLNDSRNLLPYQYDIIVEVNGLEAEIRWRQINLHFFQNNFVPHKIVKLHFVTFLPVFSFSALSNIFKNKQYYGKC
jgi:hypothetical protein